MSHAARGVAIVLLLLAGGSCALAPRDKQPLLEVYMPHFSRLPPREPAMQSIETLAKDWREGGRTTVTSDVLSAQGLGVTLAFVVILIVGWNFRRATTSRNIDLALMFLSGALFFDVMRFFAVMQKPAYLNLLDWVFIAVVFVNLALISRAVLRTTRPDLTPWTPNLPTKLLAPLAVALLALDIGVALVRPPDDAGWFVNLGAQRLRERGRLPYGDPLLTGTPGAAYGPLLYAAHVPFQILLSPDAVNPVSPARPKLTTGTPYYLPPALATQICTIAFHVGGVLALFLAARRMADARVAWGLVCLYCGSLAILGIGGREDQVAGITFVSHVAPTAMTLFAFAALKSPALSGALLAMSTGVGFYPAFMAPAWLGFYWNDDAKRIRFAIGFGLVAAAIAGSVYAMSQPAGERSRLGTIMYDTVRAPHRPSRLRVQRLRFLGSARGDPSRLQHAAGRRFRVNVAGLAGLCDVPRGDLLSGARAFSC